MRENLIVVQTISLCLLFPFSPLSSFDGVRESVHQLRVKLEDFCKEELKKISYRGKVLEILLSEIILHLLILCRR